MKLKRLLKLNQAGFSHVELGLALLVILVIAAAGVYVGTHSGSHALAPTSNNSKVVTQGVNIAGYNATPGVILNGAKPCPASYTCLGTQDVNGIYMTYYGCMQIINLSKEGEANQYVVHGYAESSASTNGLYYYTFVMADLVSTTPGSATRWVTSTHGWLDYTLAGLSHSVSMSQPNHIYVGTMFNGESNYMISGKTAGSLQQCP